MIEKARRHSRELTEDESSERQKTMDDKFIRCSLSIAARKTGLTYLVSEFRLNSVERVIQKKGKGYKPDPRFRRASTEQFQHRLSESTGQKISRLDLSIVSEYFENFVQMVNEVLTRVYADAAEFQRIGSDLAEYRGQGYVLLRKERFLSYQHNDEIKAETFERLYRNALEQAARIILSDWMRRQLLTTALEIVEKEPKLLHALLSNKRVPSGLVKRVREECDAVKKKGSVYYYVLSVLRQLRRTLDETLLTDRGEPLRTRGSQRYRIKKYLKPNQSLMGKASGLVRDWLANGYPFETPLMKSFVTDYSGSTENSPGQGYWYSWDEERENEVFFSIKLPAPVDGKPHPDNPYRTKNLTLRFFDWFPRAVKRDLRKAEQAEQQGKHLRAKQLRFRAAKYADQHHQLKHTIELQHATYQLTRLKNRSDRDEDRIAELQEKIQRLRDSRRCGPPRLVKRGDRLTLQIPFQPPHPELIDSILGHRTYSKRAGADRGIRVAMVLSTKNGSGYVDELVGFDHLIDKRELLRDQTRSLSSIVRKMQNNWERKHPTKESPHHLRKKERFLDALWRKVRRVDREIARLVAYRTTWFCEEHGVKTLFFENLKSYKPPKGWVAGTLSWKLSTNLWAKILDTTTYMRQQLGHKYGGVWTVNPAYTSQDCHACGERGIRVEKQGARTKRPGGEYFYCPHCESELHADVNAARNIIDVYQSSTVAGRTA